MKHWLTGRVIFSWSRKFFRWTDTWLGQYITEVHFLSSVFCHGAMFVADYVSLNKRLVFYPVPLAAVTSGTSLPELHVPNLGRALPLLVGCLWRAREDISVWKRKHMDYRKKMKRPFIICKVRLHTGILWKHSDRIQIDDSEDKQKASEITFIYVWHKILYRNPPACLLFTSSTDNETEAAAEITDLPAADIKPFAWFNQFCRSHAASW